MKVLKNIILLSICFIVLSSCSNFNPIGGCPDGDIDWIDVLMIQDIKYEHHYPDPDDNTPPITIEKGKELGTVSFKMADNACSNHQMKNGDATFLEVATPIYEVKGYPTALMVTADDKIYIADSNKKAKTVGELYPVMSLVKDVHLESTENGSRIHTFSQDSKEKFLDAWYTLNLEDIETLVQEGKLDGKRLFLEIELLNGVSFRQLYWADTNTFHNGAVGNKEIEDIINDEVSARNDE